MDLCKRPMAINAFSNSLFNYCPLIWMYHNRTTNTKINRLPERCLRIIYSDKQSSFKVLLGNDISVSIHDNNIQCLATKMYKVAGYHRFYPGIYSDEKIVTLTICDLIRSFLDLLFQIFPFLDIKYL